LSDFTLSLQVNETNNFFLLIAKLCSEIGRVNKPYTMAINALSQRVFKNKKYFLLLKTLVLSDFCHSVNITLHYDNNCSKLESFKQQKNIFCFKKMLVLRDFCHSVNTTLHNGNNCSKLVRFNEKNIFAV